MQTSSDAIGQLTLSDAMLGEQVIDVLEVVSIGNYPGDPWKVPHGMPTGAATKHLQKRLKADPALFPLTTQAWSDAVLVATETRNQIVHAVALDECSNCGEATIYNHPRSNESVDRSATAVRALNDELNRLRGDGKVIAAEVATLVNDAVFRVARAEADRTGEIQTPPQKAPHHITHVCAKCSADSRGGTMVHLGAALEVWPSSMWAHQKKYYPRAP